MHDKKCDLLWQTRIITEVYFFCSGRVRIYIPMGKNLSPTRVLLCRLRSPDRPLVTSNLPPLVSITANGNLHRHCRCSELIAELGYEFDTLCNLLPPILSTKTTPGFLPSMRSIYPEKTSFRLVLIEKFRVRFPPNSSRTDRVVEIGLTDLA